MVQEPGSESVPQSLLVTALTSSPYPVPDPPTSKNPVTVFLIDGIFKSSDSETDDYR